MWLTPSAASARLILRLIEADWGLQRCLEFQLELTHRILPSADGQEVLESGFEDILRGRLWGRSASDLDQTGSNRITAKPESSQESIGTFKGQQAADGLV